MGAKELLAELAQQAGLDATTRDTLLKASENDKFAKGLEDSTIRQSEFSREMDRIRTQAATLEQNRKDWKDWHDKNVGYVQDLEVKAGVKPGDRGNDPNNRTVTLTEEQLNARLKEATDRTLGTNVNITKQALKVMDDYRSRFGKALDLDNLEKLAMSENLTIQAAYDKMIAPEVKAMDDINQKKAIDDGIKAGVTAELSKRNIPLDNGAPDAAEPSPFWGKAAADQPISEAQRARNFADTWSQNAGS